MPDKPALKIAPSMSDAAVRAKTGKTWPEWFAILDKAGAAKLSHKEIVAHLVEQHHVGPWWQQMVTVTYEQARGLRAKHEKLGGFEISVSKTLNVPAAAAFTAWQDKRRRARWLPDPAVTIRKATPNKSMRLTWVDGQGSVDVNFYSKGEGKTQVSVQHGKLADAKEAASKKVYWSKALGGLKDLLEGKREDK
jgi:uncharacterized protein YndB with AHSA1/START domain